jgi:hypothetical protein
MHCDVVTVGGLFYEHRTAGAPDAIPSQVGGKWLQGADRRSVRPDLPERQREPIASFHLAEAEGEAEESGRKSKVFSFSPFY